MVTNALDTGAPGSQQVVTGSDIANLGALLAQMAAQTQLSAYDLAGYYNPSMLGGATAPTLARDQLALQRELGLAGIQNNTNSLNLQSALGFGNLDLGRDQLNAAIAQAQRQYNLDVQRFGLDVANFNYTQRLGEAQTKLQQLGLLASQRGPSDYLGYNYMLNGMAAPQSTQVDPWKFTQGMNQQYTAPPLPDVPNPPPTHSTPMTFSNPSTGSGTGSSSAPSGSSGGSSSSSGSQQQSGGGSATTPNGNTYISTGNTDWDRMLSQMADTNAGIAAQQAGNTYARGGSVPGGTAVVGDSKSGKPTGHEEMVISQFPFMVLSHDQTARTGVLDHLDQVPRAFDGGIVNHPIGRHHNPIMRAAYGTSDWNTNINPMVNLSGPGAGWPTDAQGWTNWVQQQYDSTHPNGPAMGSGNTQTNTQTSTNYSNTSPSSGGVQLDPMENPAVWGQGQWGDWRNNPWGVAQGWTGELPAWRRAHGVSQEPVQGDLNYGGPIDFNTSHTGGVVPAMPQSEQPWRAAHGGSFKGTRKKDGTPPPPQSGPVTDILEFLASKYMPYLMEQMGHVDPIQNAMPRPIPNTPISPHNWDVTRAASGGSFDPSSFFSFNTYTPQDSTNAPFVQQTLGNMAAPGWQARGQNLGPFGAQPFSYTNYMKLLPSAQSMLQGYIESPTAMGGLGGNFQDELERSRRAAATGMSFGPSVYSR